MTTEKCTSMHTICRLLARELRIERNIQQAQISQLLGKTSTSTWSKVESGDTNITLDHILAVCHICHVWPSDFFRCAENYMGLLSQHGWFVALYGTQLDKSEDLLSLDADQFYSMASSAFQSHWGQHYPVLQTPSPYPGTCFPLSVFRWSIDSNYRNECLLSIVPPIPPSV